MSVESFVPSNSLISMTDSAIRYFESRLKDQPGNLVRLSTKTSGCTGYAYVLDSVDNAEDGDELVEIEIAAHVIPAARKLRKSLYGLVN